MIRWPSCFYFSSVLLIASISFFLLIYWTSTEKDSYYLPNFPAASFLKNFLISIVLLSVSLFLISYKNSSNSISPDLVPASDSLSTLSIIASICSIFSAKPRPINGFSSSSMPIAPLPSWSKELKHSLSFLRSLARQGEGGKVRGGGLTHL